MPPAGILRGLAGSGLKGWWIGAPNRDEGVAAPGNAEKPLLAMRAAVGNALQ
jgi:hypothetical protein